MVCVMYYHNFISSRQKYDMKILLLCCTKPAEGCTCSVPISTTRVYRPIAPYSRMKREGNERRRKERGGEERRNEKATPCSSLPTYFIDNLSAQFHFTSSHNLHNGNSLKLSSNKKYEKNV